MDNEMYSVFNAEKKRICTAMESFPVIFQITGLHSKQKWFSGDGEIAVNDDEAYY